MAALGVQTDCIEYMMGHTISTYHDIEMKGVDFLRGAYAASGLSIKPKTALSKVELLRDMANSWGLTPEEIKEALMKPHRTMIRADIETSQVDTLFKALKQKLKRELTAEMSKYPER
jgi:hypothetical protein